MKKKFSTIVAFALGTVVVPVACLTYAQGPSWLLPPGAKIAPGGQQEPSRPARLPVTSPTPSRSGTIEQRFSESPILPSATPGRPQFQRTGRSADDARDAFAPPAHHSRLLAPLATEPQVVTLSPETIESTTLDRRNFERSIRASMVSLHRSKTRSQSSDQHITLDPRELRRTRFERKAFDREVRRFLESLDAASRQPDASHQPAGQPAHGIQLQRPLPERLPTVTISEDTLGQTAFDPRFFDRSIRASLSSATLAQAAPLPTGQAEEIPLGEPVPDSEPAASAFQSSVAACPPCSDPQVFYDDFSPTPVDAAAVYDDASREQWVYDAKFDVPTQHPWVEWGRIFYGNGITPRGRNWFGEKNLARPKFYLYGDYRTGIQSARNAAGRADNWANRLNLDMDLQLTDTERFHAFVGPLDKGGQFTRWELVQGDLRYRNEVDFTPVTGYFEGDAGVLLGSAVDRTSPFELPVTIGLVPLLFQNGIWMEDAVTGAAFALPARHSRLLNWSNYDATFFAVVDQLNSPAFANEHSAQAFGTAWFIEAYGGYIESGYAYVRDRNFSELTYHNITTSFTRRYFSRISNSVRVIINTGQDLDKCDRTADGGLLLVENSWISASPLRVVPYANFFYGWDRPQSVARAGVSGGILRNTGINFDTDFLNGFPTLDTTAADTAGGSIGVDLIGDCLDRQLLLEFAYLTPHGRQAKAVPDDQFALGARYQIALTHHTLWRFDVMHGWRGGLDDVYGTRLEYRWKF